MLRCLWRWKVERLFAWLGQRHNVDAKALPAFCQRFSSRRTASSAKLQVWDNRGRTRTIALIPCAVRPARTRAYQLPGGRSARSSVRRCSGSAIALISVILPSLMVTRSATNRRPRGATMAPTAPLTSTGRAA